MGGVPRKVTLLLICLLSFAGFTGVARVATGALAQTAVPSANAPCPVTAPTRTVPRAQAPSGYGPASDIGASRGFQPTGLTFPTVGCWRVVGKAGTARLTFVAEVTNAK